MKLLELLQTHLDKIAHFGMAVAYLHLFDKLNLLTMGIITLIVLMLFKEYIDPKWSWGDVAFTLIGLFYFLILR